MEDRCLLAGYSVTNMVFPGGYMYVDSAINNLRRSPVGVSFPGVMDHAVVWQNGSIIDLDPQQLHGTSFADGSDQSRLRLPNDVQVGRHRPGHTANVFLWVGGTMYDTGDPGQLRRRLRRLVARRSVNSGRGGRVVITRRRSQPDSRLRLERTWTLESRARPGRAPGPQQRDPDRRAISTAEDIIDATGPDRITRSRSSPTRYVLGPGWRSAVACLPPDRPERQWVHSRGGHADLRYAARSRGDAASAINANADRLSAVLWAATRFRWQNGVMTNLGQLSKEHCTVPPRSIRRPVVGQCVDPVAWTAASIWTGSREPSRISTA